MEGLVYLDLQCRSRLFGMIYKTFHNQIPSCLSSSTPFALPKAYSQNLTCLPYHIFFICLLDSEILLILPCWPCLMFTTFFLISTIILSPATLPKVALVKLLYGLHQYRTIYHFIALLFLFSQQMSEVFSRAQYSLISRIQFVDSIVKTKQMKALFIYPELCQFILVQMKINFITFRENWIWNLANGTR